MEIQALQARLRVSLATSGEQRYTPETFYQSGLETRRPEDNYHWDGLKRAGDSTRPFLVFQVTLAGEGVFERAGLSYSLPPGTAFLAVVPSPHRYFLPSDGCGNWSFFWLVIRHPYVVARIAERQRRNVLRNQTEKTQTNGSLRERQNAPGGGWILPQIQQSPLLTTAVTLFERQFSDRFAEEMALFTFLTEYERFLHTKQNPGATTQSEQLKEETRQFVRVHLSRPVDVTELASKHGMTRSRFSHHFKELTGEAPAHFMTRVRLEEAARRLAETDATLAVVAAECGFADANHFSKVFRRHYQLSPGTFRRQMR